MKFFDGATIMIGMFAGPGGYPIKLVKELANSGVKDLTIIANTAGGDKLVASFDDHEKLFINKQVKKIICSFPAPIKVVSVAKKQIDAGEVEMEMLPMGNLAERIRAGGAGIPAFYTPVGIGTMFQTNEVKEIDGKLCMLQRSLFADFALIRASIADSFNNLVYRGSGRNFNPIMAMAAKYVIAEVDTKIDVLDPNMIVTSGIFVDQVVVSDEY